MDIIKDFEEKISNNLIKYLRDNPEFLKENINSFEDELKYIGAKQKPKKLLPSLPYGWKRVIASARTPFPGKIFYYNIYSNTSQWELPV